MINSKIEKSKKVKKINNRRKSRELIMKSIYRGLVNQFDIKQIQKDIGLCHLTNRDNEGYGLLQRFDIKHIL